MSIIVKGMAMPTSWRDCPFSNGIAQCKLLNMEICDKQLTHRTICPLVEVPPHGDLIDRDELSYNRVRLIHPGGNVGGWNAVVMSAAIKDAPVIVPAEEGGETR